MEILAIKNKGVMEIEAMTMMGLSTKRDDDSQIGMFGTGNKYAVSVFMREGFEVGIVTSDWHGTFCKESAEFRGTRYDKIALHVHESPIQRTVHELGITAQMGLKWQLTDAIREFICNARDEGGYEHKLFNNKDECMNQCIKWINSEQCTVMILTAGSDNSFLSKYLKRYDEYYLFNRTPIFEAKNGDSSIGVYEKKDYRSPVRIYKSKVLVYESTGGSVFDYELNGVDIDESRSTNRWDVDNEMGDFIFQFPNAIFDRIYDNLKETNFEALLGYFSVSDPARIPSKLKDVILVTKELHDLHPEKLNGKKYLIVPEKWYAYFNRSPYFHTLHNEYGDAGLGKGKDYRFSQLDELEKNIVRTAYRFVIRAGYELNFKKIKYKDLESCGAWHDNCVFLDRKSLRRGVRETVDTMIHEIIHRDSGHSDYTAGFQNALVGEIVRQAMLRLNTAL